MPKSTNVLSEFLTSSRVLIENSRSLPEIAAVLAGFGYTAERLEQGVTLLDEAETLVQKQVREYGESHEATQSLTDAWQTADSAYTKTLKIARIALGDQPSAATALKLAGPRKQTVAGWLDQASAFYANVSGFLGGLSRFGYTAAKITAETALVESVRSALRSQAKESGEAQQATVDRDRRLAEFDTWISELRAVAKVAFADDRQQLEKLGIVVLNAPRAKKKVAALTK